MYLAGTSRRHETDAPGCVELDQRNGNAPADVRLLHITPVERAVLQLLADGNATRDIAVRLGVLESAVDDCLAVLFARMGVSDHTQAVAAAIRRGLVVNTR